MKRRVIFHILEQLEERKQITKRVLNNAQTEKERAFLRGKWNAYEQSIRVAQLCADILDCRPAHIRNLK